MYRTGKFSDPTLANCNGNLVPRTIQSLILTVSKNGGWNPGKFYGVINVLVALVDRSPNNLEVFSCSVCPSTGEL